MTENFRIALTSLMSNKLRAGLTMLGITIGVAAVIVLVSVGQAFDTFVREQFAGIGANLVFVVGGEDARGEFRPLTRDDVEALSDVYRVPDAIRIMPQRNLNNQPIRHEGRETTANVQGVTELYVEVFNREVIAGRFLDASDVLSLARVAVIDQRVVEALFPDVYPVGRSIRIGDVRFTVIGILGDVENSAFGPVNPVVFVPLTTVQTRLSGERVLSGDRPVTFITLQARDGNSVEAVAQQIRQTLREEHNISFRDEDDFVVFTQTEVLDTFGAVTSLITVFLALLAGISLLVGGIGIMNIMLVTVTERTREIGLRKAVGAQPSDILGQFLTEAVVLSLLGGGVGVLIAILSGFIVSALVPNLAVTVQLSSVLLATIISVMVGVFFGSYPAGRAARLNPIDALRYE